MIGRQKHGFVTCLVLRLATDGSLIGANAGHLAPYCNGEELAVAGGLPLGLDPNAVYEETSVQIPDGAHVTLMTDGVVEARGQDGELFGFDRSKSLSMQPAEEIAKAAQEFGQQDDITVLRLIRHGCPAQEIEGLNPGLSPISV